METDPPYPIGLVIQMMYHSAMVSKKTENMRASEIIDALRIFFTDEEIDAARKHVGIQKHEQHIPQN